MDIDGYQIYSSNTSLLETEPTYKIYFPHTPVAAIPNQADAEWVMNFITNGILKRFCNVSIDRVE